MTKCRTINRRVLLSIMCSNFVWFMAKLHPHSSSPPLKRKKKSVVIAKYFPLISLPIFRVRIFGLHHPFFLIWKIVWFQCNVSPYLLRMDICHCKLNLKYPKKKTFDSSVKNKNWKSTKKKLSFRNFSIDFRFFYAGNKKKVSIRFFCFVRRLKEILSQIVDQGQLKRWRRSQTKTTTKKRRLAATFNLK